MRIDVHHHWMARDQHDNAEKYMRKGETLERIGDSWHIWKNGVHLTQSNELFCRMDRQIEDMDALKIDMSILFLPAWQEWNTMKTCAYQNDYLAGIIQKYPKRFFGMAHVPPTGGPRALRELERAVRELGFKGAVITTHNRGFSVDSEKMFPFYEKMSELNVPLVITPYSYWTETLPMKGKVEFLGASVARLENPHRATLRLIYSGVMDRFPTQKFLLPHLGATFFAIKNRLNPSFFQWWQREAAEYSPAMPEDPTEKYLKRLYFDTAPPFWKDWEMKCAIQNLGEDHICFGSDYPVHMGFLKMATGMMEGLDLDKAVKQKIWGDNAAKLFGLNP
ncbi:MAG: amidohydrolase family protein [Dehalococcoidia bacterium]|nr:amidohydrolase family protein [Dehalococcoidia bacterium]